MQPLTLKKGLLGKMDELIKYVKPGDCGFYKIFPEVSVTSLYRSSMTTAQPSCRFSFAEMQSATNDFDDKLIIGHGGFGKVYIGQINSEETGNIVAIKRLDSMSNQGASEFWAEIKVLSKLRHCHLVSLIGYCDDNKEMILVYEYMPQGTLYDHLHKTETPLNWVQRLKIAIGAGRALDYLHTGVGIIHRDVKSSNILLDENRSAMISDFGLSKIGPTNQSWSYVDASVKGTFGYMDPEYFYTKKLTRKTDVYAFGVVLFELLSERYAVDERYGEEKCSLVRWAQKCVKERKLDQMVHFNIRGTISPKCLRRFAQIANRCLLSDVKARPTMTEVVTSLQALMELQAKYEVSDETPSMMGFTWKIHKYLGSATKKKPDQSGTSKSLENNLNQCSLINEDGEMPHQCYATSLQKSEHAVRAIIEGLAAATIAPTIKVEDAAATKIQSVFRSYLVRKSISALKEQMKVHDILKIQARAHALRRRTQDFSCPLGVNNQKLRLNVSYGLPTDRYIQVHAFACAHRRRTQDRRFLHGSNNKKLTLDVPMDQIYYLPNGE